MDKIFLFRTHYSIGRGIIQVNDYNPSKPSIVPNLADLAIKSGQNPVYVVDSSMSGIWPIYKSLKSARLNLVFGLIVEFVSDATDKSEGSNDSAHRNIIFIKNEKGYKELINISTKAHTDFFHDFARLDYYYLHQVWTDNLVLAVPFYHSFLARNLLTQNQCIPQFREIKPYYFIEDNELPFDSALRNSVIKYAGSSEIVEAQTVLYESRKDALSYQARRLMNRSQGKTNTLEKPNLDHFGSDAFCLFR